MRVPLEALVWGLVGRNVADAVAAPRPVRHEMHTLSRDQVWRLFSATRGERLYALWVVLATTGLRVGEALGLTWEAVDSTPTGC